MDHDTDPRLPLEATLYQVKKTIVGQDGLLERMLVALLARGHVLLKLNVPAERLEEVIGVLPAMSSPTVMTLAAGDMRALETVVPKKGVNTLIPSLKSAGARDILELPISKIVE